MMLWRRKTLYVFLITLLVLIFSLIYWNQGGDNNETIKYRIIVFGWRRRASLKRLLDSLEAADYKGRTDIPIEIFLDGEAHNLVVDYVQNFIWTHGQVKIHQRDTRIGLEKSIISAWVPDDENEIGILFEDDIEASPLYFLFISIIMKNYGKDINQNCAGISLNTPRYREIIRPLSKWVPNDAINTNGTFQKNQQQLFLFQLPASWGVVYFPYHWKILRQYYEWRTRRENENLENVVPLSETNNWNRSWKKYLVELMFMNGWYLIYPNFLNQTSLTTHHREQGEHTEAVAESPLLDTLSNVSIDFFTTPLLLDDEVGRDQLNQISIKIKPIEKLPVISFYHNLVSDISSLAALGLYTAQLAEMRGYKSQKYAFENCLPDNFFPIKRIKYKEKYLLYLPIGNLSRQLDAYLNALSFAKTLNRILLVPPLIFREKQTSCPLYSLIDPSKSTKQMTWEEFSNQAVMKPQLDRIISYESAQSPNENDMFDKILLNTYGWKKLGLKLGFLVHSGELQSILKNYDSCTDEILAFWQMHTVFDSYNYNLRDWLSSNPETISFIHANIFREEGKPIICIKAKTMTSLYSMRLAINLDENIVHHVGDYAAINLLVIKVRKNFKTLDVIPDNQLGIFLEENMCIHADYYKSDEPESEDRIALHRISKESK